jgi:tetratricopeptide (TPR) repeat protein
MCAMHSVAEQTSVKSDQTSSLARDFKAAVSAYDSGKFPEASAQLERLLLRVPKNFEVQELLGLTYGAQSQDAKAVEHLQIAVQLEPQSAVARTNLATGLFHAGKFQEAEMQCRKALEIEPQDYDANHNLAQYYIRQDKIAEALPLLETAQHARPSAYDNGYNLALAYLLTGKLEEAKPLIGALVAQKDSGELHNLLGRIDEKEGRFIEAANEFATAAHMDPSEDNLFVWASELLLHRTYEPAIAVFKAGSQRFPKSPRLWIGLGMSLYSRGEYEEAVQSLITAADLNPRDPRCYLFLSKAYLSSPKQADTVIDRFRTYANLEPNNALAQYYYAISLWKGRRIESHDVDYKSVEALLQKSITLDGTVADAHLQLGILYTDQHLYAQSLPEYQRALQLNPNLADAHFRLARYYLRAGEKARADTELHLFQELQAQHQAAVDKERAEVQQFVVSSESAPRTTP